MRSTASLRRSPFAGLAAAAVATALLLTGCSSSGDSLANYGNQSGSNDSNFTDDSGQPVLVSPANRTAPVNFTSKTESGATFSLSADRGKVVVVNFWYAGCAPCRAEAPLLQSLYSTYKNKGVAFVGVNTVDQAATAISFEKGHGITYPSVLDADTGTARIAFSGVVSASTVPVTFVLDKKGRIAARLVGELQSTSILNTLISDTLAEKN